MKRAVKIQVAAPEAGIHFDIGSTPTPFTEWSNSFKKLGRPVVVIDRSGRQVAPSRHRKSGGRQ